MHNRVPQLIVAVLPIVIPPAATAGPADRSHRDGEAVVAFQGRLRPRETHVALARFPATLPVGQIVAKLRALPGVSFAEPDYLACVLPLDTARPTGALQRAVRGRDGRATGDTSRMFDPAQSAHLDPRTRVYSSPNDSYYQAGWQWIAQERGEE